MPLTVDYFSQLTEKKNKRKCGWCLKWTTMNKLEHKTCAQGACTFRVLHVQQNCTAVADIVNCMCSLA